MSTSEKEIREMMKATSDHAYERTVSLNQQLTFDSAQRFFARQELVFDRSVMLSFGVMTEDGVYTNLGLLFSDQCPFCTKFGRFSVDSSSGEEIFVDQRVVTGSLFKQLEEGVAWLDLINKTGARVTGFFRKDFRDYPPKALRESFINALVHRDYSLTGPILVNVYEHEMEVISIGGLVKGLNLDDVRLGVSRPRNLLLATAFVKLHLVEGWGRGVREIERLYRRNSVAPDFLTSTHAFKVVLPVLDPPVAAGNVLTDETVADRILKYLEVETELTRQKIQDNLEIPQSTCIAALRRLIDDALVERIRHGRTMTYRRTFKRA